MAVKTILFDVSSKTGNYIQGKIEVSSTADSADNSSDASARIYVRKGNHTASLSVPTEGSWGYSITMGDSKKAGSVNASVLEDWVLLYTGTWKDIPHFDNGTKTVVVGGTVTAPSGTSYAGHSSSGADLFGFDDIPRASAVSASDVTMGQKCNVKWTPMSKDFRYRLRFSLGTWSETTDLIHPNTTNEYVYTGYTIPMEAAKQIPNASVGLMAVALETYSDSAGNVFVDDSVDTFYATVPNNAETQADVTMSVSPVNILGASFDGLYVQGKSRVKASIAGTAKYGASIDYYGLNVEGKGYVEADNLTSGYIVSSGIVEIVGYAKDTRGYTGKVSQSINVLPYSPPKVKGIGYSTIPRIIRCDANGNESATGAYIKIQAGRSYSKVEYGGEQKNHCMLRYRYKKESEAEYSSWTTLLSSDDLSTDEVITGALIGTLEAAPSYLIQIGVLDDIGELSNSTVRLKGAKVYWHRAGSINSFGFGCYVDEENTFLIGEDITFKVKGEIVPEQGVQGVYMKQIMVFGNTFTLQSTFNSIEEDSVLHQCIHIAGAAGSLAAPTLIHGVLHITGRGVAMWLGEGNLSAVVNSDGSVQVTLPVAAVDLFTAISGDYFEVL